MAVKIVLVGVLGSLAALCALAEEPAKQNKLIDQEALKAAQKAAKEFMEDPQDVGVLGKKATRVFPPGMEKVEYQAGKSLGGEFDFQKWKEATAGDGETPLQNIAKRNEDLTQLVDYQLRYRKYGEDAAEDKADFDVVRQGFGKAAAQGFEGVLQLAKNLEAHDADKDGRLSKAEFVTALRGAPADAKEERVRLAAKLDKDPEGLFELLRVDDADHVDIGAFVEGVSYALTPRAISLTKTAQEQTEALAQTGTAQAALNLVAQGGMRVVDDAKAALEVADVMNKNRHVKEAANKVDAVGQEANRQQLGLQKSIADGDLTKLASEEGLAYKQKAVGFATKAAEVAPQITGVSNEELLGPVGKFGKDLQKEYEHYSGLVTQAVEETDEYMARREKEGPKKVNRFKVKVNDETYEMQGSSREFYMNVDDVIKKTGVDHKTAAQALAEADGDLDAAVEEIRAQAMEAADNAAGKEAAEEAVAAKALGVKEKVEMEEAKKNWQAMKDRVSGSVKV